MFRGKRFPVLILNLFCYIAIRTIGSFAYPRVFKQIYSWMPYRNVNVYLPYGGILVPLLQVKLITWRYCSVSISPISELTLNESSTLESRVFLTRARVLLKTGTLDRAKCLVWQWSLTTPMVISRDPNGKFWFVFGFTLCSQVIMVKHTV